MVPGENMQVGSTNTCGVDLNQHFVWLDFGNLNFLKLGAECTCSFAQSEHGCWHGGDRQRVKKLRKNRENSGSGDCRGTPPYSKHLTLDDFKVCNILQF